MEATKMVATMIETDGEVVGAIRLVVVGFAANRGRIAYQSKG